MRRLPATQELGQSRFVAGRHGDLQLDELVTGADASAA
jgi:hypothetical protein